MNFQSALDLTRFELFWSRIGPQSLAAVASNMMTVISSLKVIHLIQNSDRRGRGRSCTSPEDEQSVNQILASLTDLVRAQLQSAVETMQSRPGKIRDLEAAGGRTASCKFDALLDDLRQNWWQLTQTSAVRRESIHLVETFFISLVEVNQLTLSIIKLKKDAPSFRRLWLPAVFRNQFGSRNTAECESPAKAKTVEYCLETSITRFTHWRYRTAQSLTRLQGSSDLRYSLKFACVIAILSIWPFISNWRIWYRQARGHWAVVFAMVVMEASQGFILRSAVLKISGSICGGTAAIIVYILGNLGSDKSLWLMVVLTFFFVLPIYRIALDARFGKAGLVAALAYNLVLGVGFSTDQPWIAFLERTATQCIGIGVVLAVDLTLFPYHARRELKVQLCCVIDELARAFQETASDQEGMSACPEHRILGKLCKVEDLLKITKFEPSLKGCFPTAEYENLIISLRLLIDQIHSHKRLSTSTTYAICSLNSQAHRSNNHHSKIFSAISRDLHLLSHALSTKSHEVCYLSSTLADVLSSSAMSNDLLHAEAQLMCYELNVMRQRIYRVLSGRTLPALLAHSRRISLTSPAPGSSHARRRSLSSPLQGLPMGGAIIHPAASPNLMSFANTPASTQPASIMCLHAPEFDMAIEVER